MKKVLNISLNRDFSEILAMDLKEENVYKGKVGNHSIEIVESDTCTTSYTYNREEDRDTDFKTLKEILIKI